MRIIIIGDGKVGYKLAKQLSAEKYDIIMIDSNENKLRFAMDRLDIACVTGDGADAEVLKQADVAHADLVIACTSADECNMLSCLIARKLGARHTIARVRNPIYYRQIGLLKEDLHLSMWLYKYLLYNIHPSHPDKHPDICRRKSVTLSPIQKAADSVFLCCLSAR